MSVVLKQLFEHESSTYTYLLVDPQTKQAIIIDPVLETHERDVNLIKELGVTLVYTMETHIHADHITGAALLKQKTGCKTAVSSFAPTTAFDVKIAPGDTIKAGAIAIKVLPTPGHTPTCMSFVCQNWVFTGDALLIRGCGRTDFQNGDAGKLYDSVHKQLFTLPADTVVYPAHDYRGITSSTIGEEKSLNPRLTRTREDFIEFMKNLKLSDPKKIAIAVPGNLKGGAV